MLGLAVVISPGKHVEEHGNASKATTAFDTRLPTAFLFVLPDNWATICVKSL